MGLQGLQGLCDHLAFLVLWVLNSSASFHSSGTLVSLGFSGSSGYFVSLGSFQSFGVFGVFLSSVTFGSSGLHGLWGLLSHRGVLDLQCLWGHLGPR